MAEDKQSHAQLLLHGTLFEHRFAEWQTLRAEMLQLSLLPTPEGTDDKEYEVRHNALEQRIDDAARLAMTTHAPMPWMVWRKFEILEQALFGDGDIEPYTDHRPIWMLAGIKADLIALGIGRAES